MLTPPALLRRRLPFAVVPCCVYGAEFPKRRLDSGRRVMSEEDLTAWLIERANEGPGSGCRTLRLPGLEVRIHIHHLSLSLEEERCTVLRTSHVAMHT